MKTTTVSINLIHSVPRFVSARAKQLGLTEDVYLIILLGNYIAAKKIGLPYVRERNPPRPLATIRMTLPEPLHAAGLKVAARYRLTFDSVMQSLIVRDARHRDDDLNIVPVKPNKPRLTGVR